MQLKYIVSVSLFTVTTQVHSETFYTAEALVTPYDWTYNVPTAINDNGEIVGHGAPNKSFSSAGKNTALYWSSTTALSLLNNYNGSIVHYSKAYDINNSGVIVGQLEDPDTDENIGVIWDRGIVRNGFSVTYGSGASTTSASLKQVNDNDVFVGEIELSDGSSTGVMYFDRRKHLETMTKQESQVYVNTLNNNDIAAGHFIRNGFVYTSLHSNPLSLIPFNGVYSIKDINDDNVQLVKRNNLCILRTSEIRTFGDSYYSCEPRALSNTGIAIGTSNQFDAVNADYRGFIFNTNATEQCSSDIRDINTLTVKDEDLIITEAVDINESGQIVAIGIRNGETQPYLLQPSAENEAIPFSLDRNEDGILDGCQTINPEDDEDDSDDTADSSNVMSWLIPVLHLLN